ncbi:alpha/beta hydrolase [Psychrobium sp. MM17-31]|uniref:alpha/beta fold hydrolase n=1 Tax=Psychrobium sp. MM17-31 TaxID=2917758 RepID=UPI001EF435E1|nr:alpha/beta hydrolase [Psychrobium sp. MM17-31]MCG7531816.1 alpha/beta hydrolase [Psychrobium sp. MM17-31]
MTQIPLYFLPGTQCNDRLWQQVFELLPAYFSPIALTIPDANSPLAIVKALHQQLPTQPINLIGFSLGGYLSALYATQYPESISRLMVIANHPHPLPNKELATRQFTLDFIRKNGYRGLPLSRIHGLLAPSNHHKQNIIDTINLMDKECGEKTLVNQMQYTSHRENLMPAINQAPFSTHFVIGENDALVAIDKLSVAIKQPNVSLEIIEQCGHMSPLEDPAAIAQSIIRHFRMALDNA